VRVVVAAQGDHVQDGLISRIREEGHEVVGVARDAFESIEVVRHVRPDLILLDVDPPELHGLEAARAIKERSPETRVLLVTSANGGCGEVIETLRAGVEGYVLKEMPEGQLARTLRQVAGTDVIKEAS